MSDPFELLKARYGPGQDLPAAVAGNVADHFNPVLETLFSHRSVRAFLPDALAAGTLDLLVAAAQSAPSSSNLQVWSAVAVEDAQGRERFAELVGRRRCSWPGWSTCRACSAWPPNAAASSRAPITSIPS
jgi:nitroreductase